MVAVKFVVRCSGSVVRCSKDRGEGGSVVRCSKDRGEVQQRSGEVQQIVVRCSKDRGEVQ